MSKKLSSLLIVAVCSFVLGITGYVLWDKFVEQEATRMAETATATAQAATATAQVSAPTAPVGTATAQADTASAPEATASAQEATATALYATETVIAATQTAIAKGGSPPPTVMSPTIKAIFERGYLIAGVKCDFYPMGYIQDPQKQPSSNRWENEVDCDPNTKRDYKNDERAGFEIEIVKEFAKRWLGDESAVRFKTVKDPADNIMKLTEGEVDLVAAIMTHAKDRDKDISFSQTYFHDGQGLLVRDSSIESVEDLDGKSVAVLLGTTSSKNIETEAERLGVAITVVEASDDRGVELLRGNKVDAYTTDSVRLIHLSEKYPSLEVVKVPSSEEAYQFSEEPYGMGVSKGDAEFRDLVNFTLQEMKSDGTYDRIYASWFGDEIYEVETWPGPSYLNVNLTPMLRIEAGEFTLGSEDSPTNRRRPVDLEAFSIDQYEVTNRLYKQCVDYGECQAPQNTEQYANPDNKNHPVTWVTFEQAKEYCAYVGKRLPTEDEWEAAARGSDERIYPWGNETPTRDRANFNGFYAGALEVIWSISSHENHVSPYGLHHMAGNVGEWVLSEPGQEVTRGGGWKDTAEDIKTTTRFVGVNMVADDVGFRCAVKAEEFPSPLP